MNLHKQDILCPDCGINYIDEERYKNFKKCISCARRETMASTKNLPYIKYIDLPEEEKERLEKQRARNNDWARRRNNKDVEKIENLKQTKVVTTKVPMEEKKTNERLITEFLNAKKYLDVSFVSIKTTELYSQYMNYCSIKHYGVMSRQEFYRILIDVFGFSRKMSNGSNYMCKGDKSKQELDAITVKMHTSNKSSEQKVVRANQIYTDDIISEVVRLASTEKTITELREEIIQLFPDKNITVSNFNNIIVRHNIPHKAGNRWGKPSKIDVSIEEAPKVEEYVPKVEEVKINKPHFNEDELDEDGDPIRLVPIKEEVVKTMEAKYKQNKCDSEFNYTVDDYINMLEMLEYLMENVDNQIKKRDRQFNIANDYQFDIVHEMENELASNGDTYLQDKMYVLRDFRRYIEIDSTALRQMKPLLNTLKNGVNPNNPISSCIKKLKQTIVDNAQPKYIPRIDVGMTKKYDWAIMRNSNYKKAVVKHYVPPVQEEPITNMVETIDTDIENNFEVDEKVKLHDKTIRINKDLKKLKSNLKLTEDQVKAGFNIYRVSCKLSGGGYGAFRPWYKDYVTIKQEIAMDFAKQELARLKGVYVTELACLKINME